MLTEGFSSSVNISAEYPVPSNHDSMNDPSVFHLTYSLFSFMLLDVALVNYRKKRNNFVSAMSETIKYVASKRRTILSCYHDDKERKMNEHVIE